MPPRRSARVTATFRIDADVLAKLQQFCRDQAGAPLYATRANVIEGAILRELARLESQLKGGGSRERNHRAEPTTSTD